METTRRKAPLTSSLMEDRRLYGGTQEEYNKKVAEIVKKLTSTILSGKNFENLVATAARERRIIAYAFNSKDKEQFGASRGGESPELYTITPLFMTPSQMKYGLEAASRIDSLLKSVDVPAQDDSNPMEKSLNFVRADGIKEQIKVEILTPSALKKVNEDPAIQAIKEAHRENPTNDVLAAHREQNPQAYTASKLGEVIGELDDLVPPESVSTNLIPIKQRSHYIVITESIEIENERYPLSMQVTCINHEDMQKIDKQQVSPVLSIHTDQFLLPGVKKEMAALYTKAIQWKPEEGVETLMKTVALLRYLFAKAILYHRGCGAIGEWVELSIYRSHGFEQVHHKQGKNGDYNALSCFRFSQFWENYSDLIELGPRSKSIIEKAININAELGNWPNRLFLALSALFLTRVFFGPQRIRLQLGVQHLRAS